jgi:hypothetical protein
MGSWQLAVGSGGIVRSHGRGGRGWVRGDPRLSRTRCETASTVWRRWRRGGDGYGGRVGAVEDPPRADFQQPLYGLATMAAGDAYDRSHGRVGRGWVRGGPTLSRTRCETASTVWRRWLRGDDGYE